MNVSKSNTDKIMMPNADILEFLFATIATIVATITGLIGAFSTFRLQNIGNEVNLLKGLLINKKFGNNVSIDNFIKEEQYHLLEKIYDRNLDGVEILSQVILSNNLDKQSGELLLDVDNIRRNQLLHNQVKKLTVRGFANSLVFVFVSLLLLIFVNALLQTGHILWLILFVYMVSVAYTFTQFAAQIKQLMD